MVPIFFLMLLLSISIQTVRGDIISRPGYYTLGYNPTVASGTAYVITASNVILDLNSHIITGSLIGVDITFGMTNVTVKNGTLLNLSNQGIIVENGCSGITISNIRTTSCNTTAFTAISVRGTTTKFTSNVLVEKCGIDSIITAGAEGFNSGVLCSITSCSSVSVRNCFVTDNYSTLAGQGFHATSATSSYDTLLDSVSVMGNNYGSGSITFLVSCTGVTIKNCAFHNNICTYAVSGAAIAEAAIEIAGNNYNVVISNCSLCNNSIVGASPSTSTNYNFIGLVNGVGRNFVIENCTIANNSFLKAIGAGIYVGANYGVGTTGYTNLLIRNCLVANNVSTIGQGTFFGILLFSSGGGTTAYGQIENCRVLNNSNDWSGGFAMVALGSIVTNNCSLINCVALNNTSTTAQSAGFDLAGSTSCLMSNCLAAYNNGSTDALSFGVVGFGNSPFCTYQSCVAIRNGPSVPLAANQFVTGANNVPAGSVITAAYTALAGQQLQYSNEGIT